jgi:serine/threonine protein kinase/Tfp pilus assembly protein PilF
MDDNRRQRVEELFGGALDLPAEQRDAYLAEQCNDDPSLRAEVEQLLGHDAGATMHMPTTPRESERWIDTLDLGADADKPGLGGNENNLDVGAGDGDSGDPPVAFEFDETDAEMPAQIGAYAIQEILGEGGMGVVYRAEQENPRRTVALKVIKPGFASRQALRRFEYEASVLGRLQHPGIAQIYEAGTARVRESKAKRAFFAMELIRGLSLIDHVVMHGLGTRARLELIAKVCDALEHAHRNGVIHRDLKPANILVDDHGQPKVLDFGVARATDSDLQVTTVQTAVGQLVGTIPYMSPEQITGDSNLIDTRSDVYAMGVTLYELLAGRGPYDLIGRSIVDAARVIREEPPTQLSSIRKMLRGDVDTIVSKALEKDKEQRYQSAADLAADIRRFLNDEPILARPPSTVYQVRKFAKRHKAIVGGTAAVMVVLVAGIIGISQQYFRAERQRIDAVKARAEAEQRRSESELARDAAEQARLAEADQRARAERNAEHARREEAKVRQVNGFLHDMLRRARPAVALGRQMTVRDVLDAAAAQLGQSAEAMEAEVEAEIRTTIGMTYLGLGFPARAQPHLERALELRRSIDDQPGRLGQAISNLAELRLKQGGFPEAESLIKEALDVFTTVYGEGSPQLLATMHNFAGLQEDLGRVDEAETMLREVVRLRRQAQESAPLELAAALKALGAIRFDRGDLDEAEPLLREALRLRQAVLPENHPEVATSMANLGFLLSSKQQFEQAQSLLDEALRIQRQVLPAQHPELSTTLTLIGSALLAEGRAAEAETPLRESLSIRQARLPPDHWLTRNTESLLGASLAEQNRFDQAEPLLMQSWKALSENQLAPPNRVHDAARRIIRLYELLGQAEMAESWRNRLDQPDD